MTKQDEQDILTLIQFANKWYCLPEIIDDFGFWRSEGMDVGQAVFKSIKDWERNNAHHTG